MLGLSKGDSDQNYTDIDFAVYAAGGASTSTKAAQAEVPSALVGSSDRLRVEVAGRIVRYRKNGVVFYTSTLAARFPLLVDAALYSTGSP